MSAPPPIGLAFFHGWGLGPTFWLPLREQLRQLGVDGPQTLFDAGYAGPAQAPDYSAAPQWVAIGHSLGWAHALRHPPPSSAWAGLVSVGGFPHFCAAPGRDLGQPRRVVERMMKVLDHTPELVLADFLTRCQLHDLLPVSSTALNVETLSRDLHALLDIDVKHELNKCPSPLLVLATQDDPIVSAALTQHTFADRPHTTLTWLAEGGHALGYAHAAWCAAQIQTFIEQLDHGQATRRPQL